MLGGANFCFCQRWMRIDAGCGRGIREHQIFNCSTNWIIKELPGGSFSRVRRDRFEYFSSHLARGGREREKFALLDRRRKFAAEDYANSVGGGNIEQTSTVLTCEEKGGRGCEAKSLTWRVDERWWDGNFWTWTDCENCEDEDRRDYKEID